MSEALGVLAFCLPLILAAALIGIGLVGGRLPDAIRSRLEKTFAVALPVSCGAYLIYLTWADGWSQPPGPSLLMVLAAVAVLMVRRKKRPNEAGGRTE